MIVGCLASNLDVFLSRSFGIWGRGPFIGGETWTTQFPNSHVVRIGIRSRRERAHIAKGSSLSKLRPPPVEVLS